MVHYSRNQSAARVGMDLGLGVGLLACGLVWGSPYLGVVLLWGQSC